MKYRAISNPRQAKLSAMGSVLNFFKNDDMNACAAGESKSIKAVTGINNSRS